MNTGKSFVLLACATKQWWNYISAMLVIWYFLKECVTFSVKLVKEYCNI